MSLERFRKVQKAEAALAALDLSVTTKADKLRVQQVRDAMRALDDEQCGTKETVASLVDSLDTGYTGPEVLEDLRDLVKKWDKEAREWSRAKTRKKAEPAPEVQP
ncbi:MAG TPA: hypothetical protein VJN18_32570 [Polyangiaceae bacterium]|nr:hypothetical protein [Polyangiaceae bacterium]